MDGFPTSSRRNFLAVAGAAAFAGCGKVEVGDGTDRPTESEETGQVDTIDDSTTAEGDGLTHDETQWERYDPDWEGRTDTPLPADVEVEVLVENLEIPWDLAFAPSGELFVTERTGQVYEFDGDGLQTVAEPESIIDAEARPAEPDDTPHWESWFVEGGEGGMLGVAVHPNFPETSSVYAYFTADADDGEVNRVVRYDARADDPAATAEVIVDGIPADTVHNGGRLAFGPANYLWVTVGDAGDAKLAQDPDSLPGSVLRLTPDGDPAPGNPDVGDPRVYTYGHRNPQAITWLPDARPVITEHGPDGRDEVNLLRAGRNYGWPEVRKAEEYAADDDYAHPLVNTGEESWGTAGSVFYTGERVPEWTNRLVVGTLIGQHVNIVTLNREGERPPRDADAQTFEEEWYDDALAATSHRTMEDELGRIRHVEQGPDGHLYAITSNRDGRTRGDQFPFERDDVLLRLRPTE